MVCLQGLSIAATYPTSRTRPRFLLDLATRVWNHPIPRPLSTPTASVNLQPSQSHPHLLPGQLISMSAPRNRKAPSPPPRYHPLLLNNGASAWIPAPNLKTVSLQQLHAGAAFLRPFIHHPPLALRPPSTHPRHRAQACVD